VVGLRLLREERDDYGNLRPVLDRDADGPDGEGVRTAILSFVEDEVRRRGGYLLVIETSSKESYGSTRQFYDKVGCTLARSCPTTTRRATTSSST